MTVLDHTTTDSEHPAAFPRSRVETVLAILIILEAIRALHHWYPAVGLIADDKLTNLGRLVWPAFAGASMLAILRRPWLIRRQPDVLASASIGLIALSFLWSVDSTKTLFQSIVLMSVLVCGVFLSIAYSRSELVDLAANVIGATCGVTALAVAVGAGASSGQTTGFFEHKNILGLAAACGTLLLIARISAGRRTKDVWLSGAGSVVALFLSGARTSQFGVALVLIFVSFVAVRRRSQLAALILAAPSLVIYFLALRAAGGIAAVFTASGKSSDFTGRTDIWARVTELIGERPVTGWGYLSYWRDEGFPGGRPSGFEEFGLRSSHNGYLEAALGAGVLAGVLVVLTLLVLIRRGYRGAALPTPAPADLALFNLATFAAAVNFSEAFFPSSNRPLLTLLILALSAGPRMRER